MYQWEATTLIAIKVLPSGRFKVVELPARQTQTHTSRRSFVRYEQVEQFIADQYPDAELFSLGDLELEQANRRLHESPFQKQLDKMFFGKS